MGKYKDYIYSNAETQVNNISDDYAKCNITLDVAVDKIKKLTITKWLLMNIILKTKFFMQKKTIGKRQMLKGDRSNEL